MINRHLHADVSERTQWRMLLKTHTNGSRIISCPTDL